MYFRSQTSLHCVSEDLCLKRPFGNPIKTLSHTVPVQISRITFQAPLVVFTIHTCGYVQKHLHLFTHAMAMSEKMGQADSGNATLRDANCQKTQQKMKNVGQGQMSVYAAEASYYFYGAMIIT